MSLASARATIRRRRVCVYRVIAASALLFGVCSDLAASAQQSTPARGGEAQARVALIKRVVREAQRTNHLKAVIVQVRSAGADVYTGAIGESMSGVPATPAMHFRNGSMSFTYMSTLLLELVDRKKVSLDTKLSAYFPNLPHADRITLKNLANMTSGYTDYVYQPEVLRGLMLDPFRQWTPEQLIHIGVSKPMQFAPGTNWGYSHTNYVILGRVLEKITGMSLADAMQRYVLTPMGLSQTKGFGTPQMLQPALHSFTSERREVLGVNPKVPFYEDATFWNPSWTTAGGAIQVTDITDMSKSLEAVGTGKLLSTSSHEAQVSPYLMGFGHLDSKCSACRTNNSALTYGLGVMLVGPWVAQTKSFAGCSATVGYLPTQRLTVTVVVTYDPAAFNADGNYPDRSVTTFKSLVHALAPGTLPKEK